MPETKCPVCSTNVERWQPRYDDRDGNYYNCPNCGQYLISGSALTSMDSLNPNARAVLSHKIWQKQKPGVPYTVVHKDLDNAQKESLPKLEEQVDLLIRYLGEHQESPGKHLDIPFGSLRAKIGLIDHESEPFVIQSGVDEGMIDDSLTTLSEYGLRLTPAGQKRYRALKRGNVPTEVKDSNSQKDDDRSMKTLVSPEVIERIWGAKGQKSIRLFLSHKAQYKQHVSALKEELARYGVSAFVAHEDIEPDEEWQSEIELALNSMDGLVALLTEDFHESDWTDQEVGFAKGRDVPVIAVCLGRDPYGFIGKRQGIRGYTWEGIPAMAAKLYKTLHKRLSNNPRLFEGALVVYTASTSWNDSAWKVEHVLGSFNSMTKDQVEKVIGAFTGNLQNSSSFDGKELVLPLLEKWTGKEWEVRKNKLEMKESS